MAIFMVFLGILAIIVAFLDKKLIAPRLFSSVNDYFCLIQFAVARKMKKIR